MSDDRTQVSSTEQELFRGYTRSLTTLQLKSLIEIARFELDLREGNLPEERRAVLKESARERLSRDPLDEILVPNFNVQRQGPKSGVESASSEDDPLNMGF